MANKLGLVLDGGGAKGAYQIGALRALAEYGYDFQGIVGTSIGALNGALLCQDQLSLGQTLWEQMDYSQVFAYDSSLYEDWDALMQLDVSKVDFKRLSEGIGKIIRDGGLDNEPMQALVHEHLDEHAIRQSGRDYGLVTVNVSDMRAETLFIEDMPDGSLESYVLASAYVPVFKTGRIMGKHFLDGAFYDNSPVGMLLEKGYDDIIVIKLGGRLALEQSYDGSKARIRIIEPSEDLGDLLDFDRKKIRYNIQLGYFDGLKLLGGLKGNCYYIRNMPDTASFITALSRIRSEELLVFRSIWASTQTDDYRYIFEVMLNKAAQVLGMDAGWSYEALQWGVIEHFMAGLNLHRFKVYDWEALKLSLAADIKSYKKEQPDEIALEVILKLLTNL